MMTETQVVQAEATEKPRSERKYALARNFVLRLTGFPAETIQSMASPELSAAVDESFALRRRRDAAAEAILSSEAPLSRNLRRRLKNGKGVPETLQESAEDQPLPENVRRQVEQYRALYNLEQEQCQRVAELYERELQRALTLLYQFVTSEPFQQVLLLSSPDLARFTPKDVEPPAVRNSHVRQREFTWISYLQRLTTKNETISFFGPTVWGKIDADSPAAATVELSEQRIADRRVYVERWVCEALVALISIDPDVQDMLPVRLADDLALGDAEAVFLSKGANVPLTGEEREFLLGLGGPPRPHPAGPMLESLLDRKLLVRNLELPVTPRPFEFLRNEIASWPEGPAKELWGRRVREIDDARAEFEQARELEARQTALRQITRAVQEAGLDGQRDSQALYASRLPVNEDCLLSVKNLSLGQPMIEQLLDDLTPWYELWRDMAGLYATRLHESLHRIWQSLGGKPVPLPVFLRACTNSAFPFKATGGTALTLGLEEEIQAAWRKQLGDRWTAPVVTLTEDDTFFLRRNFRFRRMNSFDNMAPDIQIIAPDRQSLAQGDWSLLVAEIHPDFTKWQNCFFMWCPDPGAYAQDFMGEGGHDPAVVFGNYPPFFTSAHISLCIFPYSHDWTFVGVPGPEGAQSLRSADTLVNVTGDDVQLLHQRRVLGSLLNTWNTALNTHRVELRGGRDHSPRLQVGRAIVQRETWTLQPGDELRQAAKAGGYAAFSAFREFRRTHHLPETIFVRGCMPQRLNFHKDVKPVFMDFRNPLMTEIMSKLTDRFRRLSISEMLPRLEDCWLEAPEGGHYSCEFRTVVMATKESRTASLHDNLAGCASSPADQVNEHAQ
jgi:hypothetical protein